MRAAVAVAALALLVGCAGGAADERGVASLDGTAAKPTGAKTKNASRADTEKAFMAFARCMREQGINMADPEFGGDGGDFSVKMGPADPSGPIEAPTAFTAAERVCKHHIAAVAPEGGPGGRMSKKDLDAFLRYARCMRRNGVDMPDPDPENGFIVRHEAIGSDDGPDGPTFRAAHDACKKLLGAADREIVQAEPA